ncbi:IclR family transcriptional regulator [Nocardia sp. 852002-51101_SCH5132738]|nr:MULTISPECIES: IclR family transcriptional regulator [Nocardia]OBA53241.1 IclR family transcriptional regulator [Nocardia sp. 852002-51101_SCH5132738]OBB51227.1 IclR family transcriptional regulator [Nocardia sp. 852002-51244_SCH5132740]OBF81720.1 IclR family transcriptional regulator [Mycobacterium sp. 852002-51759_SCH5129042]
MQSAQQSPHVIERAARLLRSISAREAGELSTTDLANATGLARPTAHRLLMSLAAEGLVDRDAKTGQWSLGPELYLLGAAAANRYDVTEQARDIIDQVSRLTGESAFLSARRGDETVCVSSREGSFPLRSHVLHEGIRFPLGVASAGLAILSHLPAHETDEYLARTNLVADWGDVHSEQRIRERIDATLSDGYAVNPALIVEGSWGIGAAVFDREGRPAWALSITGVETRFREPRRTELGKLLMDHAHQLSNRLKTR